MTESSYSASLVTLIDTLQKSGYPADLAVKVAKQLDAAINPQKEGK